MESLKNGKEWKHKTPENRDVNVLWALQKNKLQSPIAATHLPNVKYTIMTAI
jgi:hypothetical protein